MRENKKKLLAINQSTSALFRQLVEALCVGNTEVKLLAGYLEVERGKSLSFMHIPAIRLRKAPAWRRVWTWGIFTIQAFLAIARNRKHLIFITTNPPLVPWIAPLMKRLFGIRYIVLVYDIYPDVMTRMGMIKQGGLMDRILRVLSASSHRNSEFVITLGECMKRTLLKHLKSDDRVPIHVIPNWADVDFIKPIPKKDNSFAQKHNLNDKFVVMYSGSLGATHDIKSIVDAAEVIQNTPDIKFILIGKGTQELNYHKLINDKKISNLLILPWQSFENLPYSLSCADCQIVSLDILYEGISIPGKTYPAMAAGCAIIALSPPNTDLIRTIKQHQCGKWVLPGDSLGLARIIRMIYKDRVMLKMMQNNAREAAIKFYSLNVCAHKYRNLIGCL